MLLVSDLYSTVFLSSPTLSTGFDMGFLLYRFLELAQIYHHYKCIILTLRGKAIARVDIGK